MVASALYILDMKGKVW